MALYDTDLKDQVAGRHELWKIEEAGTVAKYSEKKMSQVKSGKSG